MQFNFEKRFENNENWYTVGVVKGLIKDKEVYAVEVMDPAGKIMCDPDEWSPGNVAVAVFGITEDEFNMFSENTEAFDRLVEKLKADIPKDRLFAEKNCVRKTDRKETIDENEDFKKYIASRLQNEMPKISVDELISAVLNSDKLCVAYSALTDRPLLNVVNDKANLILTTDEALMDKFTGAQKNIYKKVFLQNVINTEGEDSILTYFYKMGINMLGILFPDNRVLNIPMEAVFGSEDFRAKKLGNELFNAEFDRHITCFYQLLRSMDSEKTDKEAFNKNMTFLDVKIMENVLDGHFLVTQCAVKKENGEVQFSLSIVTQNETGERLIPVSSCDEECRVADGFEKVVVSYNQLIDLVKKVKVEGFVVNCKSRCSFKVTKEKMEQIEKFREWREEQLSEMKESE